ncbi:phage tail sheath subtilisin-like domain-containing protein [Sorangium sp. So ce375]|uniref:phage tail sheath family protein n=1 Tax=Sorangium sp. So ce375 TaxID=3133306 RepID=UPI003F5B6C0E
MVGNRAPGVHLEQVASRPSPVLETGVPAFVGARPSGLRPGLQDLAGKLGLAALYGEEPRPVTLDASTFTILDGALGAAWADGLLGFAVRGFFENGGRRCHVLLHAPGGFEAALARLEALDDFDVVCAPDTAGAPDSQSAAPAQEQILDLCAKRPGCFALLDAPGTRLPNPSVTAAAIVARAKAIRQDRPRESRFNGALYGPWIKVGGACPTCAGKGCASCAGTGQGLVPPSGHIAGVLSRLDHRIGVHRAPANEPLEGALDVQLALDDPAIAELNAAGLNCVRALPGRGIRPWGARTLTPDDAHFAHVNARRTYLTVARWLELAAADMTFEPNDLRLWLRINRQVTAFLDGLYRRGALQGATPVEAFYVKCDEETNPPALRERGMMVAEIGLSLARPSEFIVLRLLTGAGSAAVTGA